jgi:hypothetical protein
MRPLELELLVMRKTNGTAIAARDALTASVGRVETPTKLVCLALMLALVALIGRIAGSIW